MADDPWPLIDFAFLVLASLPVLILGFVWAVSARQPAPKWIYIGSKWTTIVLFLPWLVLAAGLVSDMAGGL